MEIKNAKTTRSDLLSLPWDIRSLVYSALLEEESNPPASPFDLPSTDCLFPFWLAHSSFIHRPPPPRFICQGLLGSCRQTRAEMSQVLEQKRLKGDLKCKMDCMVLRSNELFPSWTWYPAPSHYLSIFEVNLRIVTADAKGGNVAKIAGGFLNDPAFKLAELLEEFFYRGPAYRPVKVLRDDVRVRKLIVKIVAPPEVSEQALDATSGHLSDGSSHPEEIFRSLTTNYTLPRMLRTNIESLSVYYKDKTYHWNTADDKLFWMPAAKRTRRPARRNHLSSEAVSRNIVEPSRRSTRRRVERNHYGRPEAVG